MISANDIALGKCCRYFKMEGVLFKRNTYKKTFQTKRYLSDNSGVRKWHFGDKETQFLLKKDLS